MEKKQREKPQAKQKKTGIDEVNESEEQDDDENKEVNNSGKASPPEVNDPDPWNHKTYSYLSTMNLIYRLVL